MPGRQAGSPIAMYMQVQWREPKTGQQKVQLYCEDERLTLLIWVYNLSMVACMKIPTAV